MEQDPFSLPKLSSCKRVITSTAWDFERGSLLTLLLSRLDWAEQPGWQRPALSTRNALIQKQEAQGNKDNNMPKYPLEDNKTTQKGSERVSGGWLPAALQITRLSESLSANAESRRIVFSSLISSVGEGWIVTCKRLSTMGNKLIISNQIFHIARGGGELISDRSRISPQPVNPFAPAGKHAHSHCLGHALFSWLCCLTCWIESDTCKRAHPFALVYNCVKTVSMAKINFTSA